MAALYTGSAKNCKVKRRKALFLSFLSQHDII
jgi:hypothetical protein